MRSLRAMFAISLLSALACGSGTDPSDAVEEAMEERWGGSFTATSADNMSNTARGITPIYNVQLDWSRMPGHPIEVHAGMVDDVLRFEYDQLQKVAFNDTVARALEVHVPDGRVTAHVAGDLGVWRPGEPFLAPILADIARYPDSWALFHLAIRKNASPDEVAAAASRIVEQWRAWGGSNVVMHVATYDPAVAPPREKLGSYPEEFPDNLWTPTGRQGQWEVRAERGRALPLTAADLVVDPTR